MSFQSNNQQIHPDDSILLAIMTTRSAELRGRFH
jgi:hypothetical protein